MINWVVKIKRENGVIDEFKKLRVKLLLKNIAKLIKQILKKSCKIRETIIL